MAPESIGIIPARWASIRFPGKPLHPIAGKPLVRRVWERCLQCRELSRVVVATDDERIASACAKFGAEVAMTSPDHPSGTDRLAEAVKRYPDCEQVINIQGDEPLIDPELVDELARRLRADRGISMITAANVLADEATLSDPNVVKVVLSHDNRALYFSRSVIPHRRNQGPEIVWYRHKGIYGYQRAFLERFVSWPPSMLERCEGLEQLRALENGAQIGVVITDDESIGVDTLEQAELVSRLFEREEASL